MVNFITAYGFMIAIIICISHTYNSYRIIKTHNTQCYSFKFLIIKIIAVPLFIAYMFFLNEIIYPIILFLTIYWINQVVALVYKIKNIERGQSKDAI